MRDGSFFLAGGFHVVCVHGLIDCVYLVCGGRIG